MTIIAIAVARLAAAGGLYQFIGARISARRYVAPGSFGAFLVCAYTSQHPTDVAGVVFLDPPSDWHELTREQTRLL